MNQVDNLEFKLTVPMEKSDHGDDGWYIRGVAAGAGFVDKDGDELLPQAIQSLAAQINESPIPFRNWHQTNDITEDLGEVVKASVTPDWQLEVEVKLDQDNPQSQYLWKKLGQGKQYGLSVRGDSERPIIEKSDRRYVSKHHAIHLKEVSVTTKPYFTHSLGTVIRKAIDEAMPSLANIGENTIMADSITGETPVVQESSAPENDTVASGQASPSNEEVAKAILDTMLASDEFKTLVKSAVAEVNAEAATTTETSTEDNTEIEKSDTEEETSTDAASTQDVTEIVKSAVEEVSKAFAKQLEDLANKIPDAAAPAVLVKSENENIQEVIASLPVSERLRVGLAARSGELDKIQ